MLIQNEMFHQRMPQPHNRRAFVLRVTLKRIDHFSGVGERHITQDGEFAGVGIHLDLHGLTKKEAEAETVRFIRESFAEGLRCVLVIPGRGLNSPDREPVIRTGLASWLTRAPLKRLVLAFASARSWDGGYGAFYVLLRRNEGKVRIVTPAEKA